MILPSKHLGLQQTYLWQGMQVLKLMNKPFTVSRLWSESKEIEGIGTFKSFILILSFLNLVKLIEFDGVYLRKRNDL